MAKEVVRVEDVECSLTQDRLSELESYYSLTAVNPTLPEGHERANTPPLGKITIYEKFLEYGLHFPLMPMFRKIVEAYGRPLAQYTPNLITIVLAFVHVCNKMGVEPDVFLFRCFYKLVRCGKSFPRWFSFTKNPHGPSKELVAKNESSKHWRSGFFYVDANFVSLFPWISDEGGTISLDPWTKKDKKDIETRRRDLEKLAGWKKTYTYRQIALLSDRISTRNQDEEEQHAEEGPQEVAPPETGAASSGQATRTPIESSGMGNSSGRPSGHLKRKREVPEVVEVDPLSFSLPAIHELSSLDDLLKEGYADPGRDTDLFEDVPAGHALLTFDPPRVECPELREAEAARLEDGMRQGQRCGGHVQGLGREKSASGIGKEALGRGGCEDEGTARGCGADPPSSDGKFAGHECPEVPTGHQISEAYAFVSKPEDILNIPGSPSFVFQMPRGTETPPSMPPGLDDEPEIVASAPPPQGYNSGNRGGGGTSTDTNARSRDKGKGTTSDFPSHPDGTSRGLPATLGLWETSGILWIDLQLPDPHHDPTAFPLYAAVGGALADPNVDRGRGRLSGLEGQLEEALQTFRASELDEARKAVLEAKAENNRLDKLWRDTEDYWEDHLKNSIQLQMLANNRLRTFEAKIRRKKDEGLAKPDPEDFIPRNYFESVLGCGGRQGAAGRGGHAGAVGHWGRDGFVNAPGRRRGRSSRVPGGGTPPADPQERKRLEEEVARMKAQLDDAELTHRLQMESLLATSVPKSRLDTYILAGVQRYLGSSEFALGINDVMDPAMERGARKVVLEIEAAQKKNEDIWPVLEKYADRDKKGKTSAVRFRCKARKHFRDMDFASLPIMQQISEAYAFVSKPEDILNIPGLEGQLEEALQTFRASELDEARKAVLEEKAENNRLDKLWRDTEDYWEDHLKNSIQLQMLANNRLRTFEAKIRRKKDEGLAKPDPEDFIPRNYFESVLVHLRKAYALVAVKWDRSFDKIEALRSYAGQLWAALESAISFIMETGKEYDFAALWPEPCPAMRDEPTSPTREAERLIYENDALFFELGQGCSVESYLTEGRGAPPHSIICGHRVSALCFGRPCSSPRVVEAVRVQQVAEATRCRRPLGSRRLCKCPKVRRPSECRRPQRPRGAVGYWGGDGFVNAPRSRGPSGCRRPRRPCYAVGHWGRDGFVNAPRSRRPSGCRRLRRPRGAVGH
ncbi:OLC1v1016023C1 [Oldenlandia corymbosa var. corymbosa]|uniref:OLC1v1016023C1 n=1 Tax=Oldenlandia corymbosa var. corymbosa TaxID=529605 RepID=A0AAV1E511_OLDCO|nr:OLC1v1016023C1 [Oldenlandia corymbosa var. corymbosa]